jgi:HAD superfamily hydrolase (TIGR01549 family)
MVRALFFDLTGTLQLFDWDKQWPLLQKIIEKETNHFVSLLDLKQKYQQCYESYRLGWIKNDIDFFDLLFRQLALNVSKKQLKKIVIEHLKIRKNFTWLPKDYDITLKELRKYFRLVIVSSGCWPWGDYDFEKIFGFKMNKHFDLIVNSFEEGYLKDSGKLFEIALKKLKLKPSEVAYVGDNYKKDILLAKNFGLKTVFLNNKKIRFNGDITITSFSNLNKKVNELKSL